MELPHSMVQIASQVGNRLRTDRLARQRSHHTAHLTGGDAAQKSLADQQGQFRGAALELVDRRRKKAAIAGTGDAQPKGTEGSHKVPFLVAVAVLRRLPWPAFIAVQNGITVTHPLDSASKMLPGQLGSAFQIAPEALLQVRQKMLEMLGDGYNLRHGCKAPFQVGL